MRKVWLAGTTTRSAPGSSVSASVTLPSNSPATIPTSTPSGAPSRRAVLDVSVASSGSGRRSHPSHGEKRSAEAEPRLGGASITTRPTRSGRRFARIQRVSTVPRLCPTRWTRAGRCSATAESIRSASAAPIPEIPAV